MTVVTATILSEGELMDPTYEVVSIDVTKEVDRVPEAELTLLDGESARGEFPVSDTALFEPGKTIEIQLRNEGQSDDVTIFKGVVIRHGLEVSGRDSMLVVRMKDAAIKLTQTRKSTVFREKADHEIVKQIVEDAGLETGDIAETRTTHLELVQYEATDWDFVLARADVLGLTVFVDDGVVSLLEAGVGSGTQHSFQYGVDEIFEFTAELDAAHQMSEIEGSSWDVREAARTEPVTAREFSLTQGNLDGAALAQAVGFETYTLSHQAPIETTELQAWTDGRMARSRMSLIRGRLSVPGFAEVKPLDELELTGVGARFDGTTIVTGVRHRVSAAGWRTDLQFGLSHDWFCTRPEFEAKPASGLLPSVAGLQVGIVEAFEEDPDGQLRVKVLLPCIDIDAEKGSVWARLATPDAGEGRGFFFRPEPGDEVVVGFVNSDPRQPVILGSMFGPKNTHPEGMTLDENNEQRAIVTRSGTRIEIVDAEKPSVTIQTPAENKIVLDDDAESIVLSDQHGNTITLDSNGIQIDSAGDVKITASGNVEIEGSEVDVK